MERMLEKVLDETKSYSNVVGVICADSQGLCLQSQGRVSNHSAGLITYLAETAAKLEPATQESPVIILESDSINVYIKSVDKVTTAVYTSS